MADKIIPYSNFNTLLYVLLLKKPRMRQNLNFVEKREFGLDVWWESDEERNVLTQMTQGLLLQQVLLLVPLHCRHRTVPDHDDGVLKEKKNIK